MVSRLIYSIGIQFYIFGIYIASFFNTKARLWLQGRRNWQVHFAADWQQLNPNHQPCVWVHCASLGEFEQGRPLIEQLKVEYPQTKILLTFFSPSGYEIRKNYAHADYVCYLPADARSNALIFIDLFKPTLSIFVKYEFWYHYLMVLYQKHVSILLISAIFRENQVFFKWYGGLFRGLLPTFKQIFTQNQASANLLQQIDLQNFIVVGDTRIDRVLKIAQDAPSFPLIEVFAKNYNILVIGSSWQPDEAILLPFINKKLPTDWKVIIAPHDIAESHIRQIEQALNIEKIRYSNANSDNVITAKVLLIDNIGMLAALYRYGKMAYIGGGFGAGIHNTLEPIAFGLPVVFGPKFQKFEEAVYLTQHGGAFVIKDLSDFQAAFDSLQDETSYEKAAAIAKSYIIDNQGATQQILTFIKNNELL